MGGGGVGVIREAGLHREITVCLGVERVYFLSLTGEQSIN